MKIVPIFESNPNRVYAIRTKEGRTDEFTRAFRDWSNVQFLEAFFESNKHDLHSPYFGKITVEDAVINTIDEAGYFLENIKATVQKGNKERKTLLSQFVFKPLSEKEQTSHYEADKAYGMYKGSWLRLYAVKIDETTFIVTGSAIKLTQKMQDRQHTILQLERLRKVAKFLKDQGILPSDDFGTIEIPETT